MEKDRRECQICGRAIKSKSGVIAHHGYQRPGMGWQTNSCAGARHLPYDVAHDVLDREIVRMSGMIPIAETAASNFIANPPDELKETPRRERYSLNAGKAFPRPEGFDAAREAASGTGRGGYQGLFVSAVWRDRANIKGMKEYLAFIQERRNNWKGPLQ